MSVSTERLGLLYVAPRILCEWLQFPNATVRACGLDPATGDIRLLLADGEMPLVKEGMPIQVINPLYCLEEKPCACLDGHIHRTIQREPLENQEGKP